MAVPAFLDLTSALRSRDAATALLASFAARGDVRSLLRALGVLATSPSAWLDGARVNVELREHEDGTLVSAYTDHGGVRERALPDVVVDTSFAAIVRALLNDPDVVAPARQRMRSGVLILTDMPMGTTKPPPAFDIAPECTVHEKATVKRRKVEIAPEAFRSGGHKRRED